jgi:hypothetical protein
MRKKVVNDAVKGDVKSAEMLLTLWQHLMKNGDAGPGTIRIRTGFPTVPVRPPNRRPRTSRLMAQPIPPNGGGRLMTIPNSTVRKSES